MKTLTKTFGLVAVLSLIAAANAEVITKGGASALMSNPALRPGSNPAMACAKCTSTFATRTERAMKGAEVRIVFVEKHGCAGCTTTIVTRGEGKAKVEVAKHECGMTAASSCCAKKS